MAVSFQAALCSKRDQLITAGVVMVFTTPRPKQRRCISVGAARHHVINASAPLFPDQPPHPRGFFLPLTDFLCYTGQGVVHLSLHCRQQTLTTHYEHFSFADDFSAHMAASDLTNDREKVLATISSFPVSKEMILKKQREKSGTVMNSHVLINGFPPNLQIFLML